MSKFASFRVARRLLVAALVVGGSVAGAEAHAQTADLSVSELQLSNQLQEGVAVEPTTTFSRQGGNIYAVVRVQNPSRAATRIVVSLVPVDGEARGGTTLEVPARPRYRTVARFSAARTPGRYRCVVRTEDGRELSSVEITISA